MGERLGEKILRMMHQLAQDVLGLSRWLISTCSLVKDFMNDDFPVPEGPMSKITRGSLFADILMWLSDVSQWGNVKAGGVCDACCNGMGQNVLVLAVGVGVVSKSQAIKRDWGRVLLGRQLKVAEHIR